MPLKTHILITGLLVIGVTKNALAQDISQLKKQTKESATLSVPTIIIEPFVANANCVTKQSAAIEVRSDVAKGACLLINANESIDLTEPFDAKNGSTFDASLIITTIVPPVSVVNCENFQNHTATDPHIFAKASTNEFYGECISQQIPEYKIEGLTSWKKMTRICGVVGSTNTYLHVYNEPYDGIARNTYMRSREGCAEYPDVRSEQVNKNLFRDWVALPTLTPIKQDKSEVILFVNTELENTNPNGDIIIYNIYTDRPVANLKGRINGTTDVGFTQSNWGWFAIRPAFNVSLTDYFVAKKDFVLDITTDNWQTVQRFVVYRNHQGGHYSATITMTRADGRVFVTTHSINYEVSQKLVNKTTGQAFNSIPQIDGVFDLGYLADGDYNFQLQTFNGFVAESDILVRVKKKL